MRFASLEAVGLRCIVQLARSESTTPRGISNIANAEFFSPEYTAITMRLLRMVGLTKSTRCHSGNQFTPCPKGNDCSVPSLWRTIRTAVRDILAAITIEQRTGPEIDVDQFLYFAETDLRTRTLQ